MSAVTRSSVVQHIHAVHQMEEKLFSKTHIVPPDILFI